RAEPLRHARLPQIGRLVHVRVGVEDRVVDARDVVEDVRHARSIARLLAHGQGTRGDGGQAVLLGRVSHGSIGGRLRKFYDIFVSLDILVSVDLTAVLVTALLEFAGLVYIAKLLHSSRDKMDADDDALYLQGRRVEEVLREMRAELLRR